MAFINETLTRKKKATEAGVTAYAKYKRIADRAKKEGFHSVLIKAELEGEAKRISDDIQNESDPIFQDGVHNAKVACLNAIALVILELEKGEK